MRIHQLPGWPPWEFQASEERTSVTPSDTALLRVKSAGVVLGTKPGESHSDVVLLLQDDATDKICSTRIKLKDVHLALRTQRALSSCEGLTLAEAGKREIPGEPKGGPELAALTTRP